LKHWGPNLQSSDGVNGTLIPVNAPKLNPKASAGAINANLRALDRTGKPCRRWSRTPFSVKSFTGAVWIAGSWGSPKRPESAVDTDENFNGMNGESKSNGSATASDGRHKQNVDSSAVASEKSTIGDVGAHAAEIMRNGVSPAAVEV
jgi:hypothetical protein